MKCHKSCMKIIPFLLHCILVAAGKGASSVGKYLQDNNYEKGKALIILIAMPWYFIHFKNINRAKAKCKIPRQNQPQISMLLISLTLLLCLFSTIQFLPFSTYRFINWFNSFPPAKCTFATINESLIIIGCCKIEEGFQNIVWKLTGNFWTVQEQKARWRAQIWNFLPQMESGPVKSWYKVLCLPSLYSTGLFEARN